LRIASKGQGIPASVVLAEHLGDSSILHLKVAGVKELLNAKVGTDNKQCESGEEVGLLPDAAWALTFGADGRLIL
jgi:multiple sugar transport system ATP-binding protein